MRRKLLLAAGVLTPLVMVLAAPPAWWAQRGVLDTGNATTAAGNYAPANLGQLKNMAKQAKAHLDQYLPSGSGPTIGSLVAGFGSGNATDNYAPVNLGQLKAVAKPFYDRLLRAGYDTQANLVARGFSGAGSYPWNPATPTSDNYAPANLGQLKIVFSFDVSSYNATAMDPDGDGLSTPWELAHGLNPNASSTQGIGIPDGWLAENGIDPLTADPQSDDDEGTGDGLSLAEEYEFDLKPDKKDSDGDGVFDGEDGWGKCPELAPARLPKPTYAVIEVGGPHTRAFEINNYGAMLIMDESGNYFYKNSATEPLQPIVLPGRSIASVYGLNDAGYFIALFANPNPVAPFSYEGESWRFYKGGSPIQLKATTRMENDLLSLTNGTSPDIAIWVQADYVANDGASYGWASAGINGGAYTYIAYQGINWEANGDQSALGGYRSVAGSEGTLVNSPDYAWISTTSPSVGAYHFNFEDVLGHVTGEDLYKDFLRNNNGVTFMRKDSGSGYTVTWFPYSAPLTYDSFGSWKAEYVNLLHPQTSYYDADKSIITSLNDKNILTIVERGDSPKTTLWVDNKAGLRNNQPVDGAPQHRRILWSSAWGDTPIIGLNTKMRAVSGGILWQNEKSYAILPFIPAANGDNSTWTDVTIDKQNDNGALAGRARKRSDGQWYAVELVPFEVVSDLNNDGKVGDSDRTLKSDGAKSGATDDQKEKATEYIFANDDLSNGAWDKDDTDPNKPQDAKDDDDAEELSTICAATWGAVWFEHPAIDKMSFYKTKECKPADKVTFPFALSDTNKLPEKLFVRVDVTGFTAQAAGDLVMKFGKSDKSETWADDKLKLTVIKQMGDEKFFQAARDYILERNTELFAQNWGSPVASPTTYIRMCVMREEGTTMSPYESYWTAKASFQSSNPPPGSAFDPVQWTDGLGVEGVAGVDSSMTVVINGNQFTFSDGTTAVEAYAMFLLGEPLMTDKCHGRLVIGGALSSASSDHADPNTNAPGTSMKGSELAGPDPASTGGPGGKYFAQTGTQFSMGAGRLPTSVSNGIGGLSGSYNLGERSGYPNSMVGYAPMKNDGKGAIFVACGLNGTQGKGKVVEFYQAAKDSKVPEISGATASNGLAPINLLLLDSGVTSPGLAHKNPKGDLKLIYQGTKHVGNPYYPNDFLRFKAQKPRNPQP